MLRFGIIGTGRIGDMHARIVAEQPDAVVTRCFDVFEENACRSAEAVGAKVTTDLSALLGADDVDAVEQVFSKAIFGDGGFEIAVRGGEDSYVELVFLVTADCTDGAFFQCSEQLYLHRHRHFSHFVQQQRSAVGFEEQAATFASCIRERSFDVTE